VLPVTDRYDEKKLVEMVLYVAAKLQADKSGGATKLNKVLYFADFTHVRRTGHPISGADYQKLDHGPAPRRLRPLRDRLVASGEAEMVVGDVLGYMQHRLVPRRPADTSVFTTEELSTIDEVIGDLAGLTAKQVSDLSHAEPAWPLYDEGETIPYHSAFIARQQISTPSSQRFARDIAVRYGISRGS
jgi:hypothetical protein